MEDLVLLGVITGAHGIRGEVRLKSFTAEPKSIADYGPLLSKDGRSFEIVRLKPAKDGFIVAFSGISDRDQAEALRGVELLVRRSCLPQTKQDEVYIHDLIGLRVDAMDGTVLGEIAGVQNYGAGDLLDIKIGGRKDTVLIPFADDFIAGVGDDRVVVDLPDGFLDMEEER